LGRYLLLAVIEFLLVGLPVLLVGTLVALITVPNIDTAANIDRAILPGFTMLSVIGIAVSFFGALLLTPLRIIYTAVNYIDLRTRKENLAQVLAGLPPVPSMPAVVTPAPAAVAVAPAIAPAPPPPAATTPVEPPPAPAEKIGIGIPANVDMNTLSPGQRIGVLFNRIRNEGASAALLNELGMAYMDIGDTGGAMDAFSHARELDPNDADVVYNLMLLALQRKDTNSSKQLMRDYLRLETNAGDVERVRNDPRFAGILPE
jgi:tetratricopeptide (TPR) repeat protein